MKKLKAVMLGPSLQEKGGMGTVSKLILQNSPEFIKFKHISTWNGSKKIGQDKVSRLTVFLQALIAFLGELMRGQVDLVHVHIAERGSVFRKSILILIAVLFHKPVICHTHGAEFHIFHSQLPSLV